MARSASSWSAGMSETAGLAVFALHQRTASLGLRERAAIRLASIPLHRSFVALSSCHRVELYIATAGGRPADQVREALGLEIAPEVDGGRWYEGEEAVRHLLRVTAGLDSVVVGEGQIAGQVRRLHDEARQRGIAPVLDRALRRALAVARDLRTLVGSHGRSVGSLAVDEALAHVPDPISATALVIGAGEIGKLSARALARRVGRVVVANRDVDRARELAERIGASAVGLDALEAELAAADVVISAADTRGGVLTRALLGPRCSARPLVLVDIAVPRSVAEDARDLPGLRYRDVDGLAAERAAVSPELVDRAERRCADEARAFMADLHARAAAGTIRALRERAEDVRRRKLDRALRKLTHLPERDRRVVEGLASSLVGAIVHAPTATLRGSPDRAEAARALFGLELDGDGA
jgi:glutamyl-tRNA reductase